LEANPGTVTQSSLQDFSHVGINRLSLGIQSFDDKNLKFLGRIHNRQTALMAINYAQKYFTNYSLDLIYALPKQTLDELESELSMLSQISPPHLSFYQLTLEKGTPFYRQIKNPISDTLAAKMFNYVNHSLKKMGYINYEISNFAKPHQECLHNMSYWNGDEYIGCGPTAASRIQIGKQWFEGKESIEPKDLHLTKISARERMREMIITGLRTKQGFNLGNLTKFNLILDQVLDISKVSELSKQHLVKLSSTHLRVLTRGKLFLNYINQEIIL
jgi:oxygen-independent coproporphyrinogen-3 oxidase